MSRRARKRVSAMTGTNRFPALLVTRSLAFPPLPRVYHMHRLLLWLSLSSMVERVLL